MHPIIKKKLTQDIGWESLTGRSGAGDSTFAALTTVKGYSIGKQSLVTSAKGVQLTSQQVIYFDGASTGVSTMKAGDKFTLITGKTFPALHVQPFYIGSRLDLLEVYL